MIEIHLAKRREPERLLIDYRLDNRSTERVYASVRTLLRRRPSRRPYTFLPFDALLLRATFRTPPPPPGIAYFGGAPSLSCPVEPRSSHTGFAEMEVPVKELQPFGDPPWPDTAVGLAVGMLELEFEWTVEAELDGLREVDPEDGLFIAMGPPHRTSAHLSLEREVEVLRRPGPYHRF